jgi:uncharacterized protein (TIGR00661 family)
VTPLDWGLGHATRCIPVINALLSEKCDVLIAGSGRSLDLLRIEFPQIKTFELPAYDPEYPTNGSMVWKMIVQLPKFLKTIKEEHVAIEKIISDNKIDIVVSDNRYGCWSSKIFSVLITHQSNILMPRRFGWLSAIVRRLNERQMKKFSRWWIPDHPEHDLAGALIRFDDKTFADVDYIGSLSRFSRSEKKNKDYDVAAIFSGPEPQRSLLEEIITAQLKQSSLRYFIVRGLPQRNGINLTSNIEHQTSNTSEDVVDFMGTDELKDLIESAEVVLARSGYSTIMDLAALGAKGIFIPTPGQTEQLYLAERLKEKRIAFFMHQEKFDLETAMNEGKKYSGFSGVLGSGEYLTKAITKVLSEKV